MSLRWRLSVAQEFTSRMVRRLGGGGGGDGGGSLKFAV